MARVPSSLNLLRTFEVAGRHLSFTLAAQELCITTSAVSQQMRTLEEQLATRLFERHTRALALTPAGSRYWQQVQHHLHAIDTATRQLMQPEGSQPLRISLMPPLASRIVLPRLDDFYQRYPDTELRLNASLRYTDLASNEADLAIRFGTPPWPGCTHEKLLDMYVLPVCPPAIAEQYDLARHPENLRKAPLIQMTERPESWNQYFAFFGLSPSPDQKQFFVDDYPAAVEAAETLGVALAVLPLEQPLLDSQRVVAPLPPLGPLPESVYAVVRQDMTTALSTQHFLEWLKQQLASLPDPAQYPSASAPLR